MPAIKTEVRADDYGPYLLSGGTKTTGVYRPCPSVVAFEPVTTFGKERHVATSTVFTGEVTINHVGPKYVVVHSPEVRELWAYHGKFVAGRPNLAYDPLGPDDPIKHDHQIKAPPIKKGVPLKAKITMPSLWKRTDKLIREWTRE